MKCMDDEIAPLDQCHPVRKAKFPLKLTRTLGCLGIPQA